MGSFHLKAKQDALIVLQDMNAQIKLNRLLIAADLAISPLGSKILARFALQATVAHLKRVTYAPKGWLPFRVMVCADIFHKLSTNQ